MNPEMETESCPDIKLLKRLADGESQDSDSVMRHVDSCDACRTQIQRFVAESLAGVVDRILVDEGCLDEESLVRLVRGTISADERIWAEDHCRRCMRCREERQDLQRFATAFSRRLALRSVKKWAWRSPLLISAAAGIVMVMLVLTEPPIETRAASAPSRSRPAVDRPQAIPSSSERAEEAGSSVRDDIPDPRRARVERVGSRRAGATGAGVAPPSASDGTAAGSASSSGETRSIDANLPSSVAHAIETGELLSLRDLGGIRGRTGTLMSRDDPPPPFELLSPAATFVPDRHPMLCWSALPGAVQYVATVVDDESHEEVIESEPVRATEWQVPSDEDALVPDRVYRWYVVAILEDDRRVFAPAPPNPVAKFRILTPEELAKVRADLARYHESKLARAVICAEVGLFDDAERLLQEVPPSDLKSGLARKWLAAIRAWRQPTQSGRLRGADGR
jgi:hypothetical protein